LISSGAGLGCSAWRASHGLNLALVGQVLLLLAGALLLALGHSPAPQMIAAWWQLLLRTKAATCAAFLQLAAFFPIYAADDAFRARLRLFHRADPRGC
jgi:hypothetical protein